MSEFNYLIDKIYKSEFREYPFKFVYIENFLEENHFKNIINQKSIKTSGKNFDELNYSLKINGWEPHRHPGSFEDLKAYKKWRKKNSFNNKNLYGDPASKLLCEGSGMTYRLNLLPDLLNNLQQVFKSDLFLEMAVEKFSLSKTKNINIDGGFQKYLDGYEISPHPDIREKALTWMLNLNTDKNYQSKNYHTHFMRFKKNKNYIYSLWDNYEMIQRQWVPWNWCESKFQQIKNNSITIFSPNTYSIHAIKANYYDLDHQRTQLYGNVWYDSIFLKSYKPKFIPSTFKDLDYENIVLNNKKKSIIKKLKSIRF
tara:strand:- start:25744 stop:26679 length:936 start_codon:yes stop_codon:yes gene_type:complete